MAQTRQLSATHLELLMSRLNLLVELADKALVGRPEKANVRDAKQHHGEALEAEAKRPTDPVAGTGTLDNLLLNDAAAQDFQPLILEENFQLPRGVGKGEVAIQPTHGHRPEQVLRQSCDTGRD